MTTTQVDPDWLRPVRWLVPGCHMTSQVVGHVTPRGYNVDTHAVYLSFSALRCSICHTNHWHGEEYCISGKACSVRLCVGRFMGGAWWVNIVDLAHSAIVNPLCVHIVDHLVGEWLCKINHFYCRQSFVRLLFLPVHSSNWLQWWMTAVNGTQWPHYHCSLWKLLSMWPWEGDKLF